MINMAKQTMEVTKVQENGKQEKTTPQKCAEEMQVLLDKYGCTLVCQQKEMYGQIIYVPTIAELKK